MDGITPQTFLSAEDAAKRIERLERQLARERQARLEAEAIAEDGLRDLYTSQQHLALLQRITDRANTTSDVREALSFALEQICEQMHWDFGNAYLVEGKARRAVACDIAFSAGDSERLEEFAAPSREIVFECGEGLPGAVVETGEEHWIDDIRDDGCFVRREQARASELCAGCAFPIKIGDETVAVIEFFSHKTLVRDDAVLSLMARIGTQLGRVVERQRSENLRHETLHDPLTGLPNRVMLAREAGRAFAVFRQEGTPLTVLGLDLDGFKQVNDRYGHHAGDELLIRVSHSLHRVVGQLVDVCGATCRGLVTRTGGDEFVILLEGEEICASATQLADTIRSRFVNPFPVLRREVPVGISIGIAHASADYADVQALQRHADLAMYAAKAAGDGRAVVYSNGIGERARRRASDGAEATPAA